MCSEKFYSSLWKKKSIHPNKTFLVHLLPLNVAIEAFDAHGLRGQNERLLDVTDIVTILGSLYETISVSINLIFSFLFKIET